MTIFFSPNRHNGPGRDVGRWHPTLPGASAEASLAPWIGDDDAVRPALAGAPLLRVGAYHGVEARVHEGTYDPRAVHLVELDDVIGRGRHVSQRPDELGIVGRPDHKGPHLRVGERHADRLRLLGRIRDRGVPVWEGVG